MTVLKPLHHSDDTIWMERALALARGALYVTAPNPRVGCLIVRDGIVLGSGATQATGQAHAEIMALRDADRHGHDVAGATVYVTLEPCSHHGRTPPCVDALVKARPARVVIAMQDPNPAVSGRGIARLRDAGIDVSTHILTEQALELNPGFVARMVRQTPWVWLKLAASMDGYIALPDGESKWITGAAARADGHHWRARSCVVLTGLGTVLADDPLLNVRAVDTPRQPVRAIVDTRFEVPETARFLDGNRVWVFTCRDDPAKAQRLAEKNVEVVCLPMQHSGVDLGSMLQWMASRDINEVHVEAGSRLSGAFLDADYVDELLLYMAPTLLGQGIPMAQLNPLTSLAHAQRFQFTDMTPIGSDVRLCLRHPQRWRQLARAVGIQGPASATL